MAKSKFFCLALLMTLGALSSPVNAKDSQKTPVMPMQAPDDAPKIVWHGQFGTSLDTPNEVYCLMGNNFLRAPVSADFQTLITGWQAKHPDAKVVRVFNYGPILTNRPNLSQTYVWVVDGRSNLNEYLVQQGGCPGLTMFVPPRRASLDPKTHFMMEIPEKTYLDFLDRVADAQKQAQTKKVGIWNLPVAASKSQSRKRKP